jgi:hypothetical protein
MTEYEKKKNQIYYIYILIVLGMDFFFAQDYVLLLKHKPYTTQYVLESDSVSR